VFGGEKKNNHTADVIYYAENYVRYPITMRASGGDVDFHFFILFRAEIAGVFVNVIYPSERGDVIRECYRRARRI